AALGAHSALAIAADVTCDDGALTISHNASPSRFEVRIDSAEISSYLGIPGLLDIEHADEVFTWLEGTVATYRSGAPRSVLYVYRDGAGVKLVAEHRSYDKCYEDWIDGSGYPHRDVHFVEP